MIPKIGFALQAQYSRPLSEVIALLKKAGFSAVSPSWSAELDLPALTRCVHENDMTIQYIHAPYKNIRLLWQPELAESIEVQGNILRAIDDCAKYHVPILVIHSWSGFAYTFSAESLDFRFFDRMVAYAKEKGVKLAFENLQGEEFLRAVLTRYENEPHVGYCWDSGHDNCYPHATDFLQAYGSRLIMTHLNDNFGPRDPSGVPSAKDDLHFLPYDGNIDWAHALYRLKNASPQNILNFEIKLRTKSGDAANLPYLHLPLEQFIEKAGDVARKIAIKYAEIMEQA